MHNNSVTKIHICLGFNSIIIIVSDRRRLRFCVVVVGLCTTVGSLAVLLLNNNNSEYGVCLSKEERRERLSTYLGRKE